MLHRILTGICAIPGVDNAHLIDHLGSLVASVGNEGEIPNVQEISQLISNATELVKVASMGILEEVWFEGEKRMMIDRIRSDLTLILQGQGGQLARWRHGIDRERALIAELA